MKKLVCTQFVFAYTAGCLHCSSSVQYCVSRLLSLPDEQTCLHTVRVGLLRPCLCTVTEGGFHSTMELVCARSLLDNLVRAHFVFVYTTVPFVLLQTEQFTVLWILFILIVLGNSAVLVALLVSKRRKSRMNFFIMQLALAGQSACSFFVYSAKLMTFLVSMTSL